MRVRYRSLLARRFFVHIKMNLQEGGYALLGLLVCCGIVGHALYCGKLCKDSEDCDQAGAESCSVCAYASNSKPNADGRNQEKKICMSLLQSCGGRLAPAKNESLSQYLVIGDPITQQLFPYVEKALENYPIEAHLAPGNPKTSADGLRCVKVWVGEDRARWHVISFNFGMWDIALNRDLKDGMATYTQNLKNITIHLIDQTMVNIGKTKIIFTLTTPTSNTSVCCPSQSPHRHGITVCSSDVDHYNGAANYILHNFINVTINDLWGWVNKNCCGQANCTYEHCKIQPPHSPRQCQVYFSVPEGWEYLACDIATAVKRALNIPR